MYIFLSLLDFSTMLLLHTSFYLCHEKTFTEGIFDVALQYELFATSTSKTSDKRQTAKGN